MNILDKIVIDKRKEVDLRKSLIPISQLEASVLFTRETVSLSKALRKSSSGIIAEHKRRSPSKAVINQSLNVADVAKGYQDAGVCGMSVLTDGKYFGGSLDDLILARASCNLPLLRKEFIIDPYQILEAKAFGADVILLIAAILTRDEIKQFSKLAKDLELDVLLEVHNEEELFKSLMPSLDMLGVNNRNLKVFKTDIQQSIRLIEKLPAQPIKISESGIKRAEDIITLKASGYNGFLIGELFMKEAEPAIALKRLIDKLNSL